MPRSPSRDRSDPFTGNRGYFHQSDTLRRGKYLLAIVAGVAAMGWAVVDVARPARAVYAHTHGPLADPHAALDGNCAACHVPHSAGEFGLRSVFKTRERWRDLTCERCHAGPAHHAAMTPAGHGFHADCSNCHHDHAGRNNSLVRISDAHCTGCHTNLAANHAAGNSSFAAKVTNVETDHPEFRPLKQPPERTLKFSHALHMTPGLIYQQDDTKPLTLARLGELFGKQVVARYAKPGQTADSRVALDCANCHQLDAGSGEAAGLKESLAARGEPLRSVLLSRPEGAYFLPVNFEAHCRACHPIQAPVGTTGNLEIRGFDLPHRRQSPELRNELMAGYIRELLARDHPALLAPAPGGSTDPRPSPAARTLRDEVERLTDAAVKSLLSGSVGCAKCHDTDGTGIARLPDRTVWFEHARFNHRAHRSTTCITCHPGTAAGFAPGGNVVEKEPVQILGIDSCRACHATSGKRVETPDGERVLGGGVKHNCTDCHRYHNGDHPRQGRGAESRLPSNPNTIAEFFGGKKD